MKEKLHVLKIVEYCDDDTDFSGDYCSVELIVTIIGENDSKTVIYNKCWGDYYHDKGEEKCDAVMDFIAATNSMDYDIVFEESKVATFQC